MKEFIKKFNNHNAYTAFTQTADFVKPNVSLCVNENEVHYNEYTDPRLICIYNIEDISDTTLICGGDEECDISDTFSKVEIDGTEIDLQELIENVGFY
jgi:hypothetical protein